MNDFSVVTRSFRLKPYRKQRGVVNSIDRFRLTHENIVGETCLLNPSKTNVEHGAMTEYKYESQCKVDCFNYSRSWMSKVKGDQSGLVFLIVYIPSIAVSLGFLTFLCVSK